MSYQTVLPKVFPLVLTGSPAFIAAQVRKLMDPQRECIPNSSSFAVTVDDISGRHTLWLTESSYRLLASER